MVCLDTTFLIDVLRGDDCAAAQFEKFVNSSDAITVAAPSVFELSEGIALAKDDREQNMLSEFLQSLTVLDLDHESALAAGSVSAHLIRSADQIGKFDILIGTIARKHNQAVLTRNVKDFARIPHLEVLSY